MIIDEIRSSELLAHLDAAEIAFLESIATEARFAEDEILFHEDGDADVFYIVRSGKVGLELTTPARPPIVIQTLGPGELIGLSWFFPPFKWSWRARALAPSEVVGFDSAQVRAQCDRDHKMAEQVLRIVARAAVRRLHSSRTQLLDLYMFPR